MKSFAEQLESSLVSTIQALLESGTKLHKSEADAEAHMNRLRKLGVAARMTYKETKHGDRWKVTHGEKAAQFYRSQLGEDQSFYVGKMKVLQKDTAEKLAKEWDGVVTSTPNPEHKGFKRYEAGKLLSSAERKSVLNSVRDVYKDHKLDKDEIKRFDHNGEAVYGYRHSPELFHKSAITGKGIRHYITMPDGKKAHPTELHPNIKQSEIDKAMAEREKKEKNDEVWTKGLMSRIVNTNEPHHPDYSSHMDHANALYRSRGRLIPGSYPATHPDGRLVRVDGNHPSDVEFFHNLGFKQSHPAAAKGT